MKKVVIIIIVIVVLAAAGVGAYLYFANSNYQLYSNAFTKTFKTNSMEMNTSVKAKLESGSSITSTGNFKLKDMNTTPQFINTMTIESKDGKMTVTQFGDGTYVYTDDGTNKNKMKAGDDPTPKQQERQSDSFSFDAYISEFSSLLDASKIKQLNSLEPVAEKYVDKIEMESVTGGKRFIVTLLPQAVNELFDKLISENLSNDMSPTVKLNSIKYTATVKSDYISEISFEIDMKVTAPNGGETQRVVVNFVITPVNPGKAVSFSLPSTAGF